MKITAKTGGVEVTIDVPQLSENLTGSEAISTFNDEFVGSMFLGRVVVKYQAAIRDLINDGVDEKSIVKLMKDYDPTIVRARIAVDPEVAAENKARKLCKKYFGDVDYDDIPAEMRDNIYNACLTEVTEARAKRAAKDASK